MPFFVGLDASKRTTNICVVDRDGVVVRDGVVETTPKAIANFLRGHGHRYVRVGMESWSLAAWLFEGLAKAGLPIVCINAGHAHGVLRTQRNKTDKNDARGIAELMRVGVFKTVHIKSNASQRAKALLTTRAVLIEKRRDIDNAIRGALLIFGAKLEAGRRITFVERARTLMATDLAIAAIVEPLLRVREAIAAECAVLEARLKAIVAGDPVCQRLMTAPGIGVIAAITYRCAVDDTPPCGTGCCPALRLTCASHGKRGKKKKRRRLRQVRTTARSVRSRETIQLGPGPS